MGSDPTSLIVLWVYYLVAAVLSFFSVFGVYILIRYGKSPAFTLVVSLVYAALFLKILGDSYQTLHALLA